MAFKKGQGGRPRGAANKVGQDARTAFQRLGGPDGEIYAKQLHAIATEPHGDINARLKALQIIAPYVWRKLPEELELAGKDGGPVIVKFVDA